MNYDHWGKRTLDFLKQHLAQAIKHVRISTGYFTVQGYALLATTLENKIVRLLVGYDEQESRQQLRRKIVADIRIHLSQWNIDDRRIAVINLVSKLQRGEFFIAERPDGEVDDVLSAKYRSKDHGKIYIIDDTMVINGSGNLTASGLLHNFEGEIAVDEPERVAKWGQLFEQYWSDSNTFDLTAALLEQLLKFLELSLPYDIYLKTIDALIREEDIEVKRPAYKHPAQFQQVIIERVLRQLKQSRGAFLVASTGLGKTVMATHVAVRLHYKEHAVDNVIVFAPLVTHEEWKKRLKSGGLTPEVFTRNLLDQPTTKKIKGEVNKILEALEDVDRRYLIIIDESHYFNNRVRQADGQERFSFGRLIDVVSQKKPYVLLLTATPYSKGVLDLNNQLYLLPHNAPRDNMRSDGQRAFAPLADMVLPYSPTAWKIPETDDFFDSFTKLEVVTVISTSNVAKDFATHTDEGDYVMFGQDRKWIPQIELWRVKTPVPLEQEITDALNNGYFRHKKKSFPSRGKWTVTDSIIEEQINLAWASSPLALREALEATVNNTYKVQFIHPSDELKDTLEPLIKQLKRQTYDADEKFKALQLILRQVKDKGHKTIIFVERLATAVYLEMALHKTMPQLGVACVVRQTPTGYEQKDFESEVLPLIYDFAPESNAEKVPKGHKAKHYDVLISTDAYGVGVNLQDANVVISYDLAYTADVIIQRAGRVLRFWREPRRVYLYAFIGVFDSNLVRMDVSRRIDERLNKLTQRTRRAEQFSSIPMLSDKERDEFISLSELARTTIENLGEVAAVDAEEFLGVSPFLKHLSEFKHNSEYAQNISDDISSAILYKGSRHYLYLLLKHSDGYDWTIFDIKRERHILYKEDALLDLIQCTYQTPIANVLPEIIEQHAQRAKQLWCEENKMDEVQRICALYLWPESEQSSLEELLTHAIKVSPGEQ